MSCQYVNINLDLNVERAPEKMLITEQVNFTRQTSHLSILEKLVKLKIEFRPRGSTSLQILIFTVFLKF